MTDIEDTIARVERLYVSITGHEPPPARDAPFAPIPPERSPERHVEEQLDRLLECLSPAWPERAPSEVDFTPPLSVWEGRDATLVSIELSGVSRSDVEVSVSDNVLTVTGRRSPALGLPDAELVLRVTERPFGTFRRSIVLPPDAVAEQFRAELKDGVLEIRIPRAQRDTTPKSILVQ